jgi:hypothetical protein
MIKADGLSLNDNALSKRRLSALVYKTIIEFV